MSKRTCDGYEESGSDETACAETMLAVRNGDEYYCAGHETMAGGIDERFSPPRQIEEEENADKTAYRHLVEEEG